MGRREEQDRALSDIVGEGIPEYERLVERVLADGLQTKYDETLLKAMLGDLKQLAGRLLLKVGG